MNCGECFRHEGLEVTLPRTLVCVRCGTDHRPVPRDEELRPVARTYADLTGGQRCRECGSLLRAADGEPRVSIRVSDIEDLACLLVDYIDRPEVWAPTVARLEQAVGRTIIAMKADITRRAR